MLSQDAIRTRPGTEIEQQWALCYVPFYAPPKAYTVMVFLSFLHFFSHDDNWCVCGEALPQAGSDADTLNKT